MTQYIKALPEVVTHHHFAAFLNISRPHDSIVIPLIKPDGQKLITKNGLEKQARLAPQRRLYYTIQILCYINLRVKIWPPPP